MRAILLASAFGLAALHAAPSMAFEFRVLDKLFGKSETFGTEDPDARKIAWEDLTPPLSPEAKAAAAKLNAAIDSMNDEDIADALALIAENGDELIEELDGETVSLEGYLVPLDFEATEAKEFVLVPYMGACVHVPPPPPNQIVFVAYEEGMPMQALDSNMWTPFRVTGVLRAARATTELAEVGYQMSAQGISVSDL